MKTTKNNKLIAEFMGYKLMPCNRGKAWERPTLSSIHDDYKLHGVLHTGNELKFHKSWDWLMPVVNDIINSRDEQNLRLEFTDLNYALCTTNIELVYKAVVEFITEYNNN